MSVAPPEVETKVAPSRLMESLHVANVFQVLAWSLWSPQSFIIYGEGLLHRNTVGHERRLPRRWRDWPDWWKNSPHHRTWLKLAGSVALLLFACLLAIALLMIAPLSSLDAVRVRDNAIGYVLVVLLLTVATLIAAQATAERTGNIGYLLAAALPGGIGIALLILLPWWAGYTHLYLSADPALRNAIFLLWGYGVGYFVSLVHALWPLELAGQRKLSGWYGVACLVILVIVLWASGLTLGTLNTLFTLHAAALRAVLYCCVGLLMGLVRPLEYLALVTHEQPNASRWGRAGVWWMPGSTLLPLDRVQDALSRQLDVDWPHGLRVAARLSAVSSQQEPLVQAMRHHLTACDEENLPGLLYNVCDSGAPCAGHTIKPPVVPGPSLRQRLTSTAPPAPPPKPKSPQRLAFEMELADILRHPHSAPRFQVAARTQAVGAAFWYYVEGYLYEAVDALPQISSANGPAPAQASAELAEMEKLVETFKVLMDLEEISSKPMVTTLPARPAVCLRTSTWDLIDRFARAATWAWRARRSKGRARKKCQQRFSKELAAIRQKAKEEELAECKLALGLELHWRTQIKALLSAAGEQLPVEPIQVKPWLSIYPQLDANYPWQSASDSLHHAWRSGHTAITWVSSQPMAKPGAAIKMAAKNDVRHPKPIVYNLEDHRAGAKRADLWRTIYMDVAERLKEPQADPTGRTAEVLIQWIAQLCSRHREKCILLVIRNADLLNSVVQPSSRADRLVELLCRLEREVPNVALTLESSVAPEERQQWEHRMGSVPLEAIYLPLLTRAGVEKWLQLQFDPAGAVADPAAVQAIYWHTGGHPHLLQHLVRWIASYYNHHSPAHPPSPVISVRDVDDAAGSTGYILRMHRYSEALARVLHRHEDDDVRFVLDLLAARTYLPPKPISADEVARIAAEHLRPVAVAKLNAMLARWEALEVVVRAEQGGVAVYMLRSFSFAQWVAWKRLAI